MVQKFDVKSGQVVFLKGTGNIARSGNWPVKGVIEKIGKKYFYVCVENTYRGNVKFSLDDFRCHHEDCNSGYDIYPTLEAYAQEQEHERKLREIRSALTWCTGVSQLHGHPLKPSHGAVLKIYDILKEEGIIKIKGKEDIE